MRSELVDYAYLLLRRLTHHLDTNRHFCRRLAEEILKPPPLEATPLYDLRHELERLFGKLPERLDVPDLVDRLKDDPHAQAELAVLSEYTPSKWLLERELEARGVWTAPREGSGGFAENAYDVAAREGSAATGLCFSGGGIRSATFNLGVLQALAATRRLGHFTYLSSVSGGGYIHQFLATWLHNRAVSRDAVPVSLNASAAAWERPARSALDEVQELLEPLPAPQAGFQSAPQAGSQPGSQLGSQPEAGGSHPRGASTSAAARKLPHSTLIAQPLRWLARYSNYLAPRKGLIGLDTWTIFAVWLRNTLLNLVVLLSCFISLLLLPHIPITQEVIAWSNSIPHQGWHDGVIAIGMLTCFLIPGIAFSRWVRFSDCSSKSNPAFVEFAKLDIFKLVLLLFVAACMAAPAVYRSSLPGEFSYFKRTGPDQSHGKRNEWQVNPVFAKPKQVAPQFHYSAQFNRQTADNKVDALTVQADSKGPSPGSRLRAHWDQRPVSFLPHPFHFDAYGPGQLSRWESWHGSFPWTRIAFVIGNAAGLFLLGFAARDESNSPDPDSETGGDSEALQQQKSEALQQQRAAETFVGRPASTPAQPLKTPLKAPKDAPLDTRKDSPLEAPSQATEAQAVQTKAARKKLAINVVGFLLLAILGVAFSWLLLYGVRTLFFVAAFSVRSELISSLGVVILPPLLFAIPFITLELGVGLAGDALSDEKREWIARLRAASFLTGAAWLVLTGFALLGPAFFDWIAETAGARWSVWAGWLGTTLAGVLAGRSARTKGSAETEESRPATSWLLQTVTLVAPPVFIAGMLLLVAKLTNWSIALEATPNMEPANVLKVIVAIAVFATIFVLFGSRININDFSMHSFYRDRLARCYAGASNPHRKPNRFTGFAPTDRRLPITALLPERWTHAPDPAPPNGPAYSGPFPIICTAVNLTTGEDLAYQERKAASFVFTPLFSGFDVGLTAGTDKSVQFNGFVPTSEYVYTHHGGISLATAVAISGAAASPNMGYHSSPAMAFLMTVFNVRLGWWLRNPRRRPDAPSVLETFAGVLGYVPQGGRLRSPWEVLTGSPAKTNPSVPKFGPLRLLDELLGQANDTSRYVYLTDGGHFDNMGLYELVRRRCRRIIVCDAEADGNLHFEGLGMAIRKVRLDFGVEITFDGRDPDLAAARAARAAQEQASQQAQPADPAPVGGVPAGHAQVSETQAAEAALTAQPLSVHFETHTSEAGEVGVTGNISREKPTPEEAHGLEALKLFPEKGVHAIIGTVRYPEAPDKPGHILYIKSSLTGDEPVDVLNFRKTHRTFPHDTTLNQFFTESQFESYRRLGQHILETDTTVLEWLDHFLPLGPNNHASH